jgi:S1-C subfamily serine protease
LAKAASVLVLLAVPSGSVLTRLAQKHRPIGQPTLLALGDPIFDLPSAAPPPAAPEHGLYITVVLPDGNAARAGLRGGDILLRYGGKQLTSRADLQLAEAGATAPVEVWRDGKVLDDLRLDPGNLGVAVSEDPPSIALRKRHTDVPRPGQKTLTNASWPSTRTQST